MNVRQKVTHLNRPLMLRILGCLRSNLPAAQFPTRGPMDDDDDDDDEEIKPCLQSHFVI